jgi:protein ImuB
VMQFSLLTRPLPSPDHLSTLAARLAALMGEGRCGSAELVDSWRPGAFAMKPFAPRDAGVAHSRDDTPRHRDTETRNLVTHLDASVPRCVVDVTAAAAPVAALRRFRTPIPARVREEDGRPVRVSIERSGFGGGGVANAAGPWRTSGAWWDPQSWDRDGWDVALHDGVSYRLFRERDGARWFVEGVVDWVMYIELHAASAFSFLQGASLPETLVERAAALG